MLNLEKQILPIDKLIYDIAYVDILVSLGEYVEIILIMSIFITCILAYLYNRWMKKQTKIKVRQELTKNLQDNVGNVLNDLNQTAKEALEKADNNNLHNPVKRIAHLSNQVNASLRDIISQTKED